MKTTFAQQLNNGATKVADSLMDNSDEILIGGVVGMAASYVGYGVAVAVGSAALAKVAVVGYSVSCGAAILGTGLVLAKGIKNYRKIEDKAFAEMAARSAANEQE